MRLLAMLALALLAAMPAAAQRTAFPDGTVEISYGADARQHLPQGPAEARRAGRPG